MVLLTTAAAFSARRGDRIPIGHIHDPWDDFRLVTTFKTGSRRRAGLLQVNTSRSQMHLPVSIGTKYATVL